MTPAAKKNIERLHTDDPTKVTLSASVRERVAEGIQYIYNNTESETFAKTTASITDDLMDAIENNNAVAIDINALKTSDEYTFKHSVDVATIAMILAKQQSLSKQEIYEIGISGLLHDIGKTQIPLEILNKPGRLDEEEFAVMKQHPVFGYHMIKRRGEFSEPVCLGVLQHHEKLLFSDHEAGSHKTSRSFHHKYHDKGRINTCFLNVRINRTCSISWKTVSRLFHRIQPP